MLFCRKRGKRDKGQGTKDKGGGRRDKGEKTKDRGKGKMMKDEGIASRFTINASHLSLHAIMKPETAPRALKLEPLVRRSQT